MTGSSFIYVLELDVQEKVAVDTLFANSFTTSVPNCAKLCRGITEDAAALFPKHNHVHTSLCMAIKTRGVSWRKLQGRCTAVSGMQCSAQTLVAKRKQKQRYGDPQAHLPKTPYVI